MRTALIYWKGHSDNPLITRDLEQRYSKKMKHDPVCFQLSFIEILRHVARR